MKLLFKTVFVSLLLNLIVGQVCAQSLEDVEIVRVTEDWVGRDLSLYDAKGKLRFRLNDWHVQEIHLVDPDGRLVAASLSILRGSKAYRDVTMAQLKLASRELPIKITVDKSNGYKIVNIKFPENLSLATGDRPKYGTSIVQGKQVANK